MQECEFAHGVSDLQYPEYKGEVIEEDYMADIYFNQQPRVK